MELAKKRALAAFAVIIFGFIFYKIMNYIILKKTNIVEEQYSKTFDLCRVLTKCSDHSYTGTDKSLPTYITGKEASKKNCDLTKTNLPWRKKFKCQYDDIQNISSCHDCLDGKKNEENIFECGQRKHDLNEGGSLLPDYTECLNMMGTTEMLDKNEIKRSYGLKINDLNDENRKYKGLTNDWWKGHDELYKCLTSNPDYLHEGWDTDMYTGYASSNRHRLTACSACFNVHGNNKENYKDCMNKQATCYKDRWPSDNKDCDFVYNNIF
jgi:hypothetical protein